MPPNWSKFQKIVNKMITSDLGNETVTITTPGVVNYDFITGEHEGADVVDEIKTALIPTTKDDLKDLPEGLRTKVTKKIYTTVEIPRYAKIESDFDKEKYEVIIPSVAFTAGGLVHCYRTFLGKIENISTPVPINQEEAENNE